MASTGSATISYGIDALIQLSQQPLFAYRCQSAGSKQFGDPLVWKTTITVDPLTSTTVDIESLYDAIGQNYTAARYKALLIELAETSAQKGINVTCNPTDNFWCFGHPSDPPGWLYVPVGGIVLLVNPTDTAYQREWTALGLEQTSLYVTNLDAILPQEVTITLVLEAV